MVTARYTLYRVMDYAAKFPPLLPEIEMSYKYRFEKRVY